MPIDIEALLQPISAEAPSGADIRYHPLTDQIREARRQEDGVAQGVWKRDVKTAEYPRVVKLAREALTKNTKDLQIGAWLAEALLHQEGFQGLGQGLELLQRLLENFWDTVHPGMDEDGDLEMRATPLRWTATQLEPAIRSAPLTSAGHNWYQYKETRTIPSEEDARMDPAKLQRRQEALDEGALAPEDFEKGFETTSVEFSQKIHDDLGTLLERVGQLSTLCDEKFGEASPDFGPLRNTLEEVQVTARMLLAKKGGGQQQPVQEELDEQAALEPTSDFGHVGEPTAAAQKPRRRAAGGMDPADGDDAAERLLAVARFLRKENPQGAAAYLIPRALRWGELRTAGAYPDPMFLVAPPSQVRMDLKRLALEGSWEQLREVAEEAAGQPWSRAWLDLQRYAVNACRYTGADVAALAIIAELKALLADFPELPNWTLADDTPSANAETQQWLKDENIVAQPQAEASRAEMDWAPPPSVNGDNGEAGANGQPAAPDPYDLAMEAARSGRLDEAMHILSEEVAQAQSGRTRFLRRVQLAQLCLACGNDEIGRPILEQLAEEIELRNLEAWENLDVIAQPLALLYRSMGNSEETELDRRKLYARICRLDPARALSLHR
ncbi:MAG TPA: type VI secretion system protein TssA [Bryobacteraceae bacterium]|nr:type VI secretion system protein TssA [Bryobacteraceae bacterium]